MWSVFMLLIFFGGVSVGRFAEKSRGWVFDIWSYREGWQLKWRLVDKEGS